MTLHSVAGHKIGESVADLASWLRDLPDCPIVTHTEVLSCTSEVHTEPATLFYVEADAARGVIRRRCLACAFVIATLDSDDRWQFPRMWQCDNCGQSITEVVAGLHAPAVDGKPGPGPVSWVAIGVRCVGCGSLSGVTDFVVAARAYDEVVREL